MPLPGATRWETEGSGERSARDASCEQKDQGPFWVVGSAAQLPRVGDAGLCRL